MKTIILSLILTTILCVCSGCDLFQQRETPGEIADLKIKQDLTDSIVKIDTDTKIIEEKT